MRFLKKKVCLRMKDAEEDYSDFDFEQDLQSQPKFLIKQELPIKQEEHSSYSSDALSNSDSEFSKSTTRSSNSESRITRRNRSGANSDSKNIIKNYGKAICAFASSKTAIPYIQKFAAREGCYDFNVAKFMQYMNAKKQTTNSMEHVRQLLVEQDSDSYEQRIYKRVFKETSIIFIKFFAVNWIFSGKLYHKNVHLKFRFKMLRRIQHPEQFTYLKAAFKNQINM